MKTVNVSLTSADIAFILNACYKAENEAQKLDMGLSSEFKAFLELMQEADTMIDQIDDGESCTVSYKA
jgi:hypothetical protein